MIMVTRVVGGILRRPHQALTWSLFPFQDASRSQIPNAPGVYAFLIVPNIAGNLNVSYLMYIGKTDRPLRQRFAEYLLEAKSDRIRPNLFGSYRGIQITLHLRVRKHQPVPRAAGRRGCAGLERSSRLATTNSRRQFDEQRKHSSYDRDINGVGSW